MYAIAVENPLKFTFSYDFSVSARVQQWKAGRQHTARGTRSPIDRLRKVVLPFDPDVWVPLADDPHVLLKHPPVASGDTEHRQHGQHSFRTSSEPHQTKIELAFFMAQRKPHLQ